MQKSLQEFSVWFVISFPELIMVITETKSFSQIELVITKPTYSRLKGIKARCTLTLCITVNWISIVKKYLEVI